MRPCILLFCLLLVPVQIPKVVETPHIHRVYDGPELPESQVAVLRYVYATVVEGPKRPIQFHRSALLSIDGKDVPCVVSSQAVARREVPVEANYYHLPPGRHVARFSSRSEPSFRTKWKNGTPSWIP